MTFSIRLPRPSVSVVFCCMATGCSSHSSPAQNTRIMSNQTKLVASAVAPQRVEKGTYPRLETTFSLPDLKSAPFDFEQTDVRVQFRSGNTIVAVPAFFDGGTTWRARFTPTQSGRYELGNISLNNRVLDVKAALRNWNVAGEKGAGFVRLDARDKTRFAYDSGAPYFPLGHNQAWRNNDLPDIPQLFDKMGASGENWSRVWMNSWDDKNLDWPKNGAFGTLNLNVARRWDAIVNAAEKNKIAFQMVFQHHGQYSKQVNPNWDDNPYNVKNGGFLKEPQEFFTNAQAKALTRRKLRYAVARWGYSPSILAWELFNEVQFTDAARGNEWESVAQWHREMAAFLRAQDVFHHLVTTSSTDAFPASASPVMDFEQQHVYSGDLVTSLANLPRATDKPTFVGEFGPADLQDPRGVFLHAGLWAGLMSGQSGAPQYWFWDLTEKHDFYQHFRAASAFLRASDLARKNDLRRVALNISSREVTDLVFSAGGCWETAKQSDFDLRDGQVPPGAATLPSFLQGVNHRDMNPRPLRFQVNFAQPGKFVVEFDKIAKAGARVQLSVDGKIVERIFAPAAADYAPPQKEFAIDVPAGSHTVSLENIGADWVTIRRFTLTDYAPPLASFALCNKGFVAAWICNRANIYTDFGKENGAASGTLTLRVLDNGKYRATWWDTVSGQPLRVDDVTTVAGAIELQVPPVARDIALFVRRVSPSS